METRGNTVLPMVAAAVTMVLWASAFIAIRAVGEYYSPGAMALGRLAVGALALVAVAVFRPRRPIPRGRPLALVLAYGALWFGVYAILVNAAEHHLDAGTTAMVVNVGPIIIAVLAGIYLKEGFPRGLVTGLAIAFAGVVTIAVATSTGRHDATGVLLALGARRCTRSACCCRSRRCATSTRSRPPGSAASPARRCACRSRRP